MVLTPERRGGKEGRYDRGTERQTEIAQGDKSYVAVMQRSGLSVDKNICKYGAANRPSNDDGTGGGMDGWGRKGGQAAGWCRQRRGRKSGDNGVWRLCPIKLCVWLDLNGAGEAGVPFLTAQ